ncbi:MAG: hypothetical protein GEU91_14175 [Rhizobiales bacterium]|nr:hypothetical protein [Hyphomicrobiales bacterium]
MISMSDVRARIDANVAPLAGRVEEVADLAELVARKALPQRSPMAYVIPLGFNAGASMDATGAHMQVLDQAVGVVLYVEASGDPKAKRALATIDTLEAALLAGVCGWVPAGAIDAVRAVRGRLVSVTAGAVLYQIDLALQTQLRITT